MVEIDDETTLSIEWQIEDVAYPLEYPSYQSGGSIAIVSNLLIHFLLIPKRISIWQNIEKIIWVLEY